MLGDPSVAAILLGLCRWNGLERGAVTLSVGLDWGLVGHDHF